MATETPVVEKIAVNDRIVVPSGTSREIDFALSSIIPVTAGFTIEKAVIAFSPLFGDAALSLHDTTHGMTEKARNRMTITDSFISGTHFHT